MALSPATATRVLVLPNCSAATGWLILNDKATRSLAPLRPMGHLYGSEGFVFCWESGYWSVELLRRC